MSNLMDKIKSIWCRYNPFDIDVVFNRMMRNMDDAMKRLDEIDAKLEVKLHSMAKETELTRSMLQIIGETIPDMLWLKDIDGKYVYANRAIREHLLFDMNPIGKTDIEIANKAKKVFGSNNHTFGEKCSNSDKVVLESEIAMRFLESGKLQGKMTYLEVYKAPFYVNDVLVGVCGTGRDMTEYVTAYRTYECGKCPLMNDIFTRYEFGN